LAQAVSTPDALGLPGPDLASYDRWPAADVLAWGIERFHPKLALVTAFQAEGMVLLDMASRIQRDIRVVTIDTGRLPDETYELIDQVRGRYGIVVEVVFPDAAQVETMVERHGFNLFRHDPALRELCCHVRKVVPLDRILDRFDAWIAGLRRSQDELRSGIGKVAPDAKHAGLVKIAPIADWSREQVWNYIHEHKVPYNALYDRGYVSIGCAPCTRAVPPGLPERAGRWWWESDQAKECGLHHESRSQRLEQELAWLPK